MRIPIYARPETGIYCLHLRIAGRQVKKTLRTRDRHIAMLRALAIYEAHGMSDPKKYEIDLARGVFKTDGTPEDNQALLVALEVLNKTGLTKQQFLSLTDQQRANAIAGTSIEEKPKGLKLTELLSKFLSMKNLQTRSIQQYTTNIEEFSEYLKNPYLYRITGDDITRFQEHLKKEGNTLRTIDNKISVIRTVLNFAIKQKYLFGENPAQGRNLMTKKERSKSTYGTFYLEEIQQIYNKEKMLAHKEKDPDFYFVLMLELITGVRVSEITVLKKQQFIKHEQGFTFIRILDSKTKAGVREIPIPESLYQEIRPFIENRKLPDNKVFKYLEREGKGAGNACGKKFARYLEELKINRGKLVFHSLRKFFNNYMKEHGISIEMRCQVIGHEVEGTNAEIYSQDFPLAVIHNSISPIQIKLLELVK